MKTVLRFLSFAFLAVLLANACIDDKTALPAPTEERVTVVFDSAGGTLVVTGEGAILAIEIVLPAGVLDSQATVTVSKTIAIDEKEPELFGAARLLALSLEVEPEAHYAAIVDAAEVHITIDTEHASLSAEEREELATDPAEWGNGHLGIAGLYDPVLTSDLMCSYEESQAKWDVRWQGGAFTKSFHGTQAQGTAKILAPANVVQLFGLNPVIKAQSYKGSWDRGIFFHLIERRRVFWFEHPHLGRVNVYSIPVSVKANQVAHAFPELFAEVEIITGCMEQIFTSIATRLADAGFNKIDIGDPDFPFDIQVWDFATGSTIASANYAARVMNLQTPWLDPTIYGSKDDCFSAGPKVLEQVFAAAHETFHWQQGAQLHNAASMAGWYDHARAWRGSVTVDHVGPHAVEGGFHYRQNLWIDEATANYFAYEMVRGYPLDHVYFKHGIAAFPLSSSAWLEDGGTIYVEGNYNADEERYDGNGWWNYSRQPFFKFLFDQESEGQGNELSTMVAFFDGLAAYLATNVASGQVDARPAVQQWMAGKGLTWFDFFREWALLRGCTSTGECASVDASRGRPFAHTQPTEPDLLGTNGEAPYWELLRGAVDINQLIEEPFTLAPNNYTPVDGGKSMTGPRCRFDTVASAFTRVPEPAQEITAVEMPVKSTVTVALPDNIQQYQAGTRVHVFDNIDYMTTNRYAWTFELGAMCHEDIELEAWRTDVTAGSLAFAGSGEGKKVTFVTKANPNNQTQYTDILVGNTAWEGGGNTTKCEATLEVKLTTCPCDAMPVYVEEGGPDDLVVYCLNLGTEYAFCAPDNTPLAPGLLSNAEYEECFEVYSAMSDVCGLPAMQP